MVSTSAHRADGHSSGAEAGEFTAADRTVNPPSRGAVSTSIDNYG
ncbi:hypothetical protein I547_0751 [Mycobacterium kansasii 824]|uniref:Uncharacterized protein n=1 Tax=Mycobacterium kansasii TaxID=1768 RepID=A0A1V3XTH5_MYCKA|nr:hypothetical protein I547_0751 [Mycobacterium kansasii 824]OOK82076.1 hypothetical protein BZL30_1245 [Mycobacterium kansasii]OOK83246.1 hypothetical protein BZL29_0702 [Mycobacterium kansasii]